MRLLFYYFLNANDIFSAPVSNISQAVRAKGYLQLSIYPPVMSTSKIGRTIGLRIA